MATAIIQARTGSTRLPGKVLRTLCGKSILAHDIARVRQAKGIERIIIATTTEPADIAIVAEAEALGVESFCGSEQDVLSRYYEAACAFDARTIVRITSDCPLYDWQLLDTMLTDFNGCDYLSNGLVRSFPRGLDTEIFTFAALERAFHEAKAPEEREHVTPYIYRHPELFRLKSFESPEDLSAHRWTLDTQEDWDFIEAVYTHLYPHNPLFTTADVLALLTRKPQLASINAHIEQKKLA